MYDGGVFVWHGAAMAAGHPQQDAAHYLSLIHISPVFFVENAVIDAVYPLSEGKHTRLRLKQGGGVLYAAAVSYTHLDVYKRQHWRGSSTVS